MEGFLITYNGSFSSSCTYHKLVGKVNKVKRQDKQYSYYYPGILSDVKYAKVCDGCYFVPEQISDVEAVNVIPANVGVGENDLLTARERFKQFFSEKNIIVNNL